jgi:hypothetical protein
MKRAGVRVGVGTRLVYDGEVVEVVGIHAVGGMPEVLARDSRTESVRRFAVDELMFSERSRLLSEDLIIEVADTEGSGVASVKWSAAPESVRSQARERAAHVREALTGYRSGCALTALPGGPRACYRMVLSKQTRMEAKAKELGIGLRTFARWVSQYEAQGEVGLISAKAVQPALGSKTFELFEQVALDVMREHTDQSRPTRGYVVAHANARLVPYSPTPNPLSPRTTRPKTCFKLQFLKASPNGRATAGGYCSTMADGCAASAASVSRERPYAGHAKHSTLWPFMVSRRPPAGSCALQARRAVNAYRTPAKV